MRERGAAGRFIVNRIVRLRDGEIVADERVSR